MQHKGIFIAAFQGINDLCVTGSTQSGNDQSLSFTTGKQSRTVSTFQNAGTNMQRTNGFSITTINTRIACYDTATYDFLFQFIKGIG